MSCPDEAPRATAITLANGSLLEVCSGPEGTLLKYTNRDPALNPRNCWLDLPAIIELVDALAGEVDRRDDKGHLRTVLFYRVSSRLLKGPRDA